MEGVLCRSGVGHPTRCPKTIGKGYYYSSVHQCQIFIRTFSGRCSSGFIVMLNFYLCFYFQRKKVLLKPFHLEVSLFQMNQFCECLMVLGCKLRMMAILVDNPYLVYGYNLFFVITKCQNLL